MPRQIKSEVTRLRLQLAAYALWCRIRGKFFDPSPYVGRAEAGFAYRTIKSIPALSFTLFKHKFWITVPMVLECERMAEKLIARQRGSDRTPS